MSSGRNKATLLEPDGPKIEIMEFQAQKKEIL